MKIKRLFVKRISLVLVALMFGCLSLIAQSFQVSGIIKSADGEPIIGGTVNLKGTTSATITDINGKYQIVVPSKESILVFKFLGYTTQELQASRNTIDVVLREEATGLDEVVVVGYGTQKKANLTGAVSSLKVNDISDIPVSNTSSLLQGRMSGVTVSNFSAQPGKDDDVEIRIRGLNTFGNNNPMILIDGVESTLSSVSPNDIESISVLKDAASAAIYGVRAANGVILVTTKKGSSGENRISYNGSYGIQSATVLPKFLDSWQWATLFNEENTAKGSPEKNYTEAMIQKMKNGSDRDHFANTRWLDEVFRSAAIQNHHVSMTGGKQNSNYMASLGYMKQDGIMRGTSTDRVNFRLNSESKYINLFTIGLNVAGNYQEVEEPSIGTYWVYERIKASARPTVPVKYSNGHWGAFDGNPAITEPMKNTLLSTTLTGNTNIYRFDGKGYIDIEPVKNLHFKSSYAYQYNLSDYKDFDPVIPYYTANGEELDSQGAISRMNQNKRESKQWINENLMTYSASISGHNLNFLLGQSSQYNGYSYLNAYGEDFPNNTVQAMDVAKTTTAKGKSEEATLRSWFGRINYSYQSRYLIEANLRRDESSRIPKKNRAGYFPSVSAGWNIAEEEFLKDKTLFDALKLRASWGKLGNQEIGYYPYTKKYAIGLNNYVWGNDKVSGAAALSAANPDIKWETTTTTNIGLDATLFKNKFSLTFDYFNKVSSDILMQLPISDIVGVDEAPYVNAGEVKNTGWDLNLGYNDRIGDFSWSVNANLSQVKNKITNINGRENWIDNWSINLTGHPIGSYYGYVADGLYRTQEQIDAIPNHIGSVALGDIRYTDISGENGAKDNQITDKDRAIIGNPFPQITYGFNMSAAYKGIDFAMFFQGVGKVDRINMDYPAVGGNVTDVMWNRYSDDNKNGAYPRLGNAEYNGLKPSSFWISDASYLRLKNIELGYSFAPSWLQKIKTQRLRIYVSAQNILTFTKIKNYDPEKYSADDRGYAYPNAKTFSVGLNINL